MNLAHWFNANDKPSESIACFEIGYLGYFTRNRIIDLAGLVLPGMIPYVINGDYKGGFWHYKPNYYVHAAVFNRFAEQFVISEEFAELYAPATEINGFANWGNLVIYKRIE